MSAWCVRLLLLCFKTQPCPPPPITPSTTTVDGQNWWGGVPELYNWWDPAKPGFNESNRNNVEWTNASSASALKIGWRNWGSQIRVLPEQNVLSPAVLAALRPRLEAMAGAVATWYKGLAVRCRVDLALLPSFPFQLTPTR